MLDMAACTGAIYKRMDFIFKVMVITCLILAWPRISEATLTVVNPTNLREETFTTVSYTGAFDTLTASFVIADLANDLPNIDGRNITSKFLLLTARSLRSFWDWVHTTGENLRPAAIIVFDGEDDGIGGLSRFPYSKPKSFPVVAIGRSTINSISAWRSFGELNGTLDQRSGENHFATELNGGAFWFFRIFLPIVCFAAIVLGIGRIVQLSLAQGTFVVSVMNLSILCETIGNALRLAYWLSDPLGHQRIWTDNGRNVWHTVSLPFSICATLLLTIYWHETVSRTSMKFSWSIETFKVPTYITVAFVFCVEIVFDGIVVGVPTKIPAMNAIAPAIYLIIGVLLAIFFTVTSVRILIQLRRMTQTATARKQDNAIASVAIKLIVMSACWFLILADGVVTLTPPFTQYRPRAVIWVWTLLHFLATAKSLATILAVRLPSKKGKQSSTTNPVSASSSTLSSSV